jgi:hypothetical protein
VVLRHDTLDLPFPGVSELSAVLLKFVHFQLVDEKSTTWTGYAVDLHAEGRYTPARHTSENLTTSVT